MTIETIGIGNSLEPQEETEKIENNTETEKSILSYDNLLFLSNRSIGLRHVHGLKSVEREKKEGVYGDAISTGSFINLIKPEEEKELTDSSQELLSDLPENLKKVW
ncbi:MAG: hypothetical protein KAI71_00155 [Candidatus Pacebacteria bacterium]|nr:hypothetical protein [Candidatus Paceibacterota bacterium]